MKAGKIIIEWDEDANVVKYVTEPGIMRTFDLIAILENAKLYMWSTKKEVTEEERQWKVEDVR